MVICGSYMFEFSLRKDMKSMLHSKGSVGTEGSDALCLTPIVKGIEN